MSQLIWTPGAAGPLDELVKRLTRMVEAFAAENWLTRRNDWTPVSGVPATFGAFEPYWVSLFPSSYSSVSLAVVTRRSKSSLLAAMASTSAKTREPDAGVPSE